MLEEAPNILQERSLLALKEASGSQKTPCVRWGLDSDSCWLVVKGEEKPSVKI